MTPSRAITSCFRKYVTFSGRASRSEFWWFTLFTLSLGLVASAVETAINAMTGQPDGPEILSAAVSLGMLLPGIAVGWRKLHDIGKSGLWYFGLVVVLPAGIFAMMFGLSVILSAIGFRVPIFVGTGLQLLTLLTIGSCFLYLIYWLARASQTGPNKYGPNPQEVSA